MPETIHLTVQEQNNPVNMSVDPAIIIPAISPTATVERVEGGAVVTVTDKDGTTQAEIHDGQQGPTGPTGPQGPQGVPGDVQDVQVNGVSVLQDGVANVPQATAWNDVGVVKITQYRGLGFEAATGALTTAPANGGHIKSGVTGYAPIIPLTQHMSTFYGLAKAAGDSTQSASSNAVGNYTETAKSAISKMLNAPVTISGTTPSITAQPGVRYICGEVATLDITVPASGIIDVVFESGSTATVLTVTPPIGMTIKWANGFDPTSLDVNTTYEINIADGLGVAGSWT